MNTLTDKLAAALRAASHALTELDPLAHQHDATTIDEALGAYKAEAQHASVFVAGWRPFIGWVGGFGMAYQFLLYPLLTWVWPILIARGTLPVGTTIPPVLDGDVLFAMVSGLLGIAGMRSFDKMKGTDLKMVGR